MLPWKVLKMAKVEWWNYCLQLKQGGYFSFIADAHLVSWCFHPFASLLMGKLLAWYLPLMTHCCCYCHFYSSSPNYSIYSLDGFLLDQADSALLLFLLHLLLLYQTNKRATKISSPSYIFVFLPFLSLFRSVKIDFLCY